MKVNTTLTDLQLSSKDKKQKTLTQIDTISHTWCTGNKIGNTGATSLSESLKVNTTLAILNLDCEDTTVLFMSS